MLDRSGRRSTSLPRSILPSMHVDVEVKIDDKVYVVGKSPGESCSRSPSKGDKEIMDAIAAVSMAITELLNAGACSMDAVVCACMAAAMGTDPKEAAERQPRWRM